MEDICRTCTAHIATGVDTSDCLYYAKAIGSGRKVCVDYIEADSCKADRLEAQFQEQKKLGEKLKEALEFYANTDNWSCRESMFWESIDRADCKDFKGGTLA